MARRAFGFCRQTNHAPSKLLAYGHPCFLHIARVKAPFSHPWWFQESQLFYGGSSSGPFLNGLRQLPLFLHQIPIHFDDAFQVRVDVHIPVYLCHFR